MSENAMLEPVAAEDEGYIEEEVFDPDIIDGEVLEDTAVSQRTRPHTRLTANVGFLLRLWMRATGVGGEVLAGDAAFRLRHKPDATVGIDVAYMSPALAASAPPNAKIIDGVPVLAVEVLSPSDRVESIEKKIRTYLEVGVPLTWVIDPGFRTVMVYKPGASRAQFLAVGDEIIGDPELPGFRAAVKDVFEQN